LGTDISCRDITVSGPASGNVTLAGSTTLFIYGNLTLAATGITRTFTGTLNFCGTGSHTITTNGVAFASTTLLFRGTGTYTLQDALNNGTGSLNLRSGTLDTNGKNLTCGAITATAGALTAGTLTLGASTVSATSITADAPLSINGGTSSITLSTTTASIGGGSGYTGNTFYNVTFSSAGISTSNFYGANTFNNLTFTANSGVSDIILYGNQTVNGTLTISGQLTTNRYYVRSNLIGTSRTLTVATVGSLTDIDFLDITVAGASSPWSGTRLGNCGGNTNITFPAAKTVYWNNVTGGAWNSASWAATSGGAASIANFPLAQDTAIIDDTGLNTGSTISAASTYNLKTLTSTKTNAFTFNQSLNVNGDITLTNFITLSAGVAFLFCGRATQNFTSAGTTPGFVVCAGYNASVFLADALTVTNLYLNTGGLDTNNKNLTVNSSLLTNSAVGNSSLNGSFSLTLGSSTVSIAGNTGLGSSSQYPTMTVSAGTSSVTLTGSPGVFGFAGQTLTWYNVTFSTASVASRTLYGTNTFNNLTLSSTAGARVRTCTVGGNQTVNATLDLGSGRVATERLQIRSDVEGTARTITAATLTGMSDVDFRDITGAGAASWTGTRIGDLKGNSGITFTAGATKYWNLAGTQNWSATGWATSSGGSPAVNNFPLAQDDVVFDDAGAAGTVTVDSPYHIKSLNTSARTIALTLGGSATNILNVHGDITNSATPTYGNLYVTVCGRTTQSWTSAGKSFNTLTLQSVGGTLNLADAALPTNLAINAGTFNTQNYNLTASTAFTSNSSSTRTINLGSSTVAAASFSINNATGMTFNAGTSTLNITSSGNTTLTGTGQTFYTVSRTGGGTTVFFRILGSNTFNTLTNSARTDLLLEAGSTQTVTNFSYSGASGSVIEIYSTVPGQQAILTKPTPPSAWYFGANSTNGGNNTNITFTAGGSTDYAYVKDIMGMIAAGGGSNGFFAFFG